MLVRLLSLDNGGVTAWPNQSRVHVVLLENNKEEKSSYFFRCEKGGMTSPMPFFHFGSYPKEQAVGLGQGGGGEAALPMDYPPYKFHRQDRIVDPDLKKRSR